MKERSEDYFILNNYGFPYKVIIRGDQVDIYEPSSYESNEYDKFVVSYDTIDIFIGKSIKTEETEYLESYGEEFDGNTILLRLNTYDYVFVGGKIYEFSTPNDEIIEYLSQVGNNEVPYPVAFSDKNVYLMLDNGYVPKDKFPPFDKYETYSYYYGQMDNEPLEKYKQPMLNVKKIGQ